MMINTKEGDTMNTLRGFVRKNRIKMETERVEENPNMNGMPQGSSHFNSNLKHKGEPFTISFSMGPALSGEPTVNDVLDCLASDSASIENPPHFEDWASELGYNADSRSAEQ